MSTEASAFANSIRLTFLMERLRYQIQSEPNKSDNQEFQNICVDLSLRIDFFIAINEIPKIVEELPSLLKQVCRFETDKSTKAVIMVLMISTKHACQVGWFSVSERQELIALADELSNLFGTVASTKHSIETPDSAFSKVMERFYPFVKLGHVFVSLEVKAGYTMLTHDFHISKNMPHSPGDRIRLFVAQTDNICTSECIINPAEVSFMINAKGVENRVNIGMDSGPQPPTNITGLLKCGTNILQVMGNFKGNYIIVIAFAKVIRLPEKPVLEDYLQFRVIDPIPDSDIIEGPSRVSLNCPISHKRINLPVKGQSCKHLQCFDFSNYVQINMRKPSWRCPHCNQHVCYTDIRLDQNMVKILKETGDNVAAVIIHDDGTWKAANNTDGTEEPVCEIVHDLEDSMSFLNSGPVVLDLTGDDVDDTEMDINVQDQKPHLANASDDDFVSVFDLAEHCDSLILSAGNTASPQPFSQTPSRPATTSTVFTLPNPSHQISQVHGSPFTPIGTYPGTTSAPRWNQTYPFQVPPTTISSQSPRLPVPPVMGLYQHFPRVVTTNQSSTQMQCRPSAPAVQTVTRASDLMDIDSSPLDTRNWRPRMRGSLVPGSYSPALDYMIIRPTQQSQTPPDQTPPGFPRPSGVTPPWRK